MSERNKRLIDWILLIISTALMVFLLLGAAHWFWVMLPFVGLFAVRALKVI